MNDVVVVLWICRKRTWILWFQYLIFDIEVQSVKCSCLSGDSESVSYGTCSSRGFIPCCVHQGCTLNVYHM
jgi:hypothetical protein